MKKEMKLIFIAAGLLEQHEEPSKEREKHDGKCE